MIKTQAVKKMYFYTSWYGWCQAMLSGFILP